MQAQEVRDSSLGVAVQDCAGCIITPGFIDPHVHIIGGGGEAGPASRCARCCKTSPALQAPDAAMPAADTSAAAPLPNALPRIQPRLPGVPRLMRGA